MERLGTKILELHKISKSYDDKIILDGFSYMIQKGERIGIIGKNGTGKSSFLKLLYRDTYQTKGIIEVVDMEVSSLPKWKIPILRRKLGIVTQEPQLLEDRTTYENISFALEVLGYDAQEIDSKTSTLIDLVELQENAYKFPYQLSGGEQTRVAIARALASNPLVLLCDEPTGNLDPDLSIQIVSLLEKINRAGTTVLMATHDSSIVNRRKKRVLELSDGKLIRDENEGTYI